MAHSLFDALAGGMSNIENQSAIQSILDAQTPQETPTASVEEEDVFQCGKCKKQFTSLQLFVSHKQTRCVPLAPRHIYQPPVVQGINTNNLNSAFTAAVSQAVTVQRPQVINQPVTGFTTVSQNPLNQLTHNMVLTDDQMLTFSDIGQTVQNGILQGSTLHLTSNPVQTNGPFLSQMPQMTSRPNNVTILSPIQSSGSLSVSNGSVFTTSVSGIQPLQQVPQHITIAAGMPEKPATIQHIIKPSPTKAGRKSAQACAIVDSSIDDTDAPSRHRPRVVTDDLGKKKLICNYCGKVFTKNFDLQQHIRSHTGEKPFQCVVCGRAFAQKSNVKKHMSSHKVWPTGPGSSLPSQPPALLVPVEESEKEQEAMKQQEEEAPPEPQEQCPPTEETVEDDLTDKEKAHSLKLKVVIDNSYLCSFCPEKFRSYYQLKSHMVKHKNVQVYRCVVKNCTATFQDLDTFLEHTTSHSEDMSYRCHQCSKVFSSLHDLGLHQYTHGAFMNSSKSGPRFYQCNQCLNKYATPEALEHHMSTTDHKFPCPHCQKNFTCERFLRRHLSSHGTEGLFECPVCHKTFKTEHYLKNHMLIHTGEKPYECEECGAAFNRKDKLKRHSLIHDKRIRFKCPFRSVSGCEKEFNRPDKLKAHIITHSGLKPYTCQICGKEFGRRPHLKEHERGHLQQHPYKCSKCNRGFFRPKVFKEHRCENANGQLIKKRAFQPRRVKRRPGRPRKAGSKPKETAATMIQTHKKGKVVKVDNVTEKTATKTIDNVESVIQVEVPGVGTNLQEGEGLHGGAEIQAECDTPLTDTNLSTEVTVVEMEKPKKKKECYVKIPSSVSIAPAASMVEQYVTVQYTSTGNGDEIQAQLIPASDITGQFHFPSSLGGHMHISPSSSTTTFHPIQIIEGSNGTFTMSQGDQLSTSYSVGEANVIDIPVDIVTVTDGHTLVCSQEVSNAGDAGEQTYSSIDDYGTVEGEAVLQGSENLINSSVAILDSEHVAEMASLES